MHMLNIRLNQQYSLMLKRMTQSPINRHNKSNNKHDVSPKKNTQKLHTIHNQQKLKVYIKFKPNSYPEEGTIQQVKYINDKQIEIKTAIKNKMYKFDHVFNGYQNHQQVFEIGCKEIIDNVFIDTYEKNHANHGLIFVYGNTGTGKTYSMGLLNTVDLDSTGIVPDSLKYIFQMKRRKCYENYDISVSFCQVYMDQIYDLLDFQVQAKLSIRQESKTRQPYIQNQTIIEVRSVQQAFQIINIGLQKRRVAQQRMNRKSSRGHGLITINLAPPNGQKAGKICFIDLAGCQRLKDSQSKGTTLNEALHINSSLSSLETLLMNISDQNIRNYRSSKLTRILQPYIQYGNINLFVTTTHQSVNAIEFAKRCKGIKFMQKELRHSTLIKHSNITQKQSSKISKQIEQLIIFRNQAIEREKKLITCVVNLISMIKRISKELQHTLQNQTLHNKFSYSEIINNVDIQTKINNKIRQYESKEESIIKQGLQKLLRVNKFQVNFEEVMKLVNQPTELTRQIYDHTHQIVNSFKTFGIYAEYKNLYKKQYFTSQLKLSLLESKCQSYEDSIHYFIKYMNTSDKRVIKRLKQLGISIAYVKNKKPVQIDKRRSTMKQVPQASQHEIFNKSDRRSPIYIDQM